MDHYKCFRDMETGVQDNWNNYVCGVSMLCHCFVERMNPVQLVARKRVSRFSDWEDDLGSTRSESVDSRFPSRQHA